MPILTMSHIAVNTEKHVFSILAIKRTVRKKRQTHQVYMYTTQKHTNAKTYNTDIYTDNIENKL